MDRVLLWYQDITEMVLGNDLLPKHPQGLKQPKFGLLPGLLVSRWLVDLFRERLSKVTVGVGSIRSNNFRVEVISAVLLGIQPSALSSACFPVGADLHSPGEFQPGPWLLPGCSPPWGPA